MKRLRREFIKGAATLAAFGIAGRASHNVRAQTEGRESEMQWWSIRRVGDAFANGEITSWDLTNFMLDRIDRLDKGRLNSYLTVMYDEARAMAKAADERRRQGKSLGPLDGVPIAVKDLIYTKGVKTTNGCAVLADFVPEYDATVVKRLKAAGAVLIGKLNQTEGAMGGYNPDPEFPLPKNPWNAGVWAGASSSGSGVATAAGLAFATLGTDTGGSIRFPAAACGVVGLKPTWGRVSRHGVFPLAESLDHIGPLARSTEDCAIVFDAIAGHDPMDATSLASVSPRLSESLASGLGGIRLGWDPQFAGGEVDPEVFSALSRAVETIRELGAQVVTVNVPKLSGYNTTWDTLCTVEAIVAHSKYYPSHREEYGSWFREWLDLGSKVSGSEYARAVHQRNECTGKIRRLFQEIDVLICPVMATPPFPVTRESLYGPMPADWADNDFVRFTAVFNFSGSPALAVPCGFTREGLPLSMQLVGRLNGESLVCRVGHAFEQATQFHLRHPEVG